MTRRADRADLLGPAIAAFGGPHTLSLGMALWSYPITLGAVVWVGWAVAGPSAWWLVVATAVQLEMVLLGWLARPFLLPLLREKPRPVLMLVFFSVVGYLRGGSSAALVLWFGLQPAEQLGYRAVGGSLITVATVFFVAWALDGSRRHRELMAELRGIGQALATSRERLAELLLAERQRILSDVDAMVAGPVAELHHLMADGEKAAAELAVRIDRLIDAVKPLSCQLATQIRPWSPTITDTVSAGSWLSRMRGVAVRRPLLPLLHAITLVALTPTVLAAEIPFPKALSTSLLGSAAAWLLLWVGDELRARVFGARGLAMSALIVAVVSTVAVLPGRALLDLVVPTNRNVASYQTALTEAVLLMGLVIMTVSINQQLGFDAEEQLRARNAELAAEIARVSGRLWSQQNRIAQLLHGEVQGTLIVAVARLTAVTRGETPMPPAAESLDPIDEALAELGATAADQEQTPDVEVFFGQLAKVWGGAMQVDGQLGEGVSVSLAAQPTTTSLLIAIIRELVNNAYRHGNSSHVQIAVELEGVDAVRLEVVSNGPGPDERSAAGLGSRLLDATALEWSRDASPAGVKVWAVFPLRQQRGSLGTQALIATPTEPS